MSLPNAIQQQVEEADRIAAELDGMQPEPGTLVTGEQLNTSDPNPLNTQPEPLEQTKPVSTDEDAKWEQRYRTLQGMYDAEVPRLHAQTKELNKQLEILDSEMQVLKTQKAVEREKAAITEKDREDFGPDLIDLIERAAEAKVDTLRAREAELVGQINSLHEQLNNVSQRQVVSDQDAFLARLSAKAPVWQALNTDSGFLNWLKEVDPVYGIPRQYALTSAYEALDDTRVAAIFNAYGGTATPATQSAAQELQRQTSPSRSRSAPAPADTQNLRVYSNRDIEQFYAAWRRGEYSDEVAARIENDIQAAMAQGRIRA